MEIRDCIELMTKAYLSRVVDSIYKESIPKGPEDNLKQKIEQNIEYLYNYERLKDALNMKGIPRANRSLTRIILSKMLEMGDWKCNESDLYDAVVNYEKWIVDKSQNAKPFAYSNKHNLDVYKNVLEVALEDAYISEEEFPLLERLREKLQISKFEHLLLKSNLGMFPKENNELHTDTDIKRVHVDLQKKGILFYCNQAEPHPLIALPQEIGDKVAKIIEFEMSFDAQNDLLKQLNYKQIHNACKELNLPVSGTKMELSQRLIEAQIKPSQLLDTLTHDELYQMCNKLSGVSVSGNKKALIQNVINYYASLKQKPDVESEDKREIYYHYLKELAERDNKELSRFNLINKDSQMEQYFEEGTKFLFEKKLNCELVEFDGTEKPDGAVYFDNGELLLWDNKGKEHDKTYTFPKSHVGQFLRYIRNAPSRVNVFLIIVPTASENAEKQAWQLKYKSGTDTDICIITASDLKYVADNWQKHSKSDFDLNIFNITGILDRNKIEQRMKFLLDK